MDWCVGGMLDERREGRLYKGAFCHDNQTPLTTSPAALLLTSNLTIHTRKKGHPRARKRNLIEKGIIIITAWG